MAYPRIIRPAAHRRRWATVCCELPIPDARLVHGDAASHRAQ